MSANTYYDIDENHNLISVTYAEYLALEPDATRFTEEEWRQRIVVGRDIVNGMLVFTRFYRHNLTLLQTKSHHFELNVYPVLSDGVRYIPLHRKYCQSWLEAEQAHQQMIDNIRAGGLQQEIQQDIASMQEERKILQEDLQRLIAVISQYEQLLTSQEIIEEHSNGD